MARIDNIEIRSEEVQEVMGTPPSWITRRGITIISSIILLLLVGSYFYKYPDIIEARTTILSENPPVSIVARTDGKLDKLFVQDRQNVLPNAILGIIENPANYYDVYKLIGILDSIQPYFQHPEKLKEFAFKQEFSLGQFHSYYSSFVSQLKDYQTFSSYNPNHQRVLSLNNQVKDYQDYLRKLDEQVLTLQQDYYLQDKQFSRDSLLLVKKVMSDVDLEKSKASLLAKKYSFQSASTNYANTKITINQLKQQITEQKVSMLETEKNMQAVLKERYDNLVNQLKYWEQTYVFKTPIKGMVAFTNFWSINQFVSTGSVVFTVIPEKGQKIIGRATVPVAGAGKLLPGQRVNIKLDNYPYLEYGIIEGKISKISLVPVNTEQESYYTAEIDLTNGLITNYKKELPFNQKMQGTAEIITKDRRLIERLIEPLFAIFKERIWYSE